MDYTIEEFACRNDGKRIYGVLYRPQKEGKMPLVIFAHELSQTHVTGEYYAQKMAEKGIAVYLFDFCGGSPRSKSDGKTTEMTAFSEVSDLEAVLSQMGILPFVDRKKIALLGSSLGGMVAAITAARHAEKIAALMLLYPGFSMIDENHNHFAGPEQVPEEFSYLGWIEVGKAFVTEIWEYDVYQELCGYTGPVQILHGDRDQLVPLAYSERAASCYSDARLDIIEDAGHGFWFERMIEATEILLRFLQEQAFWKER